MAKPERCRSLLSIQALPNSITFVPPWGNVREITENYVARGNYYLQHCAEHHWEERLYIYIYNKHSRTHRASPLALHWRRKHPKHSQELSYSCSAVVIQFSGFKDVKRQLCLKVSWPLFNFLSSNWVWNKRTTPGIPSWGKSKALQNGLSPISSSQFMQEVSVAPWQAGQPF